MAFWLHLVQEIKAGGERREGVSQADLATVITRALSLCDSEFKYSEGTKHRNHLGSSSVTDSEVGLISGPV